MWVYESLLGIGSFGEVWRASLLANGRPCLTCALKVSFAKADAIRFQAEMEVLERVVRLGHPGVISIRHIAEEDGKMIVGMDLADSSLFMRGRMRGDGALERADIGRYIGEVAVTLDSLHGDDVVHGGINPTDILICGAHAKLSDFTSLMVRARIENVPTYKRVCMAPEIIAGLIDPRGDQYALAATYVWMCTGKPFSSPEDLPTFFNKRESRVLRVALATDPNARFVSCRAFAGELGIQFA